MTKNKRVGWLPRYKEREGGQCASCPFLEDNDIQFGSVVDRLRRKKAVLEGKPIPKPATKKVIDQARRMIRVDVLMGSGDFVCHSTAYGANMGLRAQSEHRQCPGATKLVQEVEEEHQ